MTRLEGVLTAIAILGISIFNVCAASAHQYNESICVDWPWACAPEAAAITQASRHSVTNPHSVTHAQLTVTKKSSNVTNESLNRYKNLVPQLGAKVTEIISVCGSKLISGFRPHAVVAGTHRASLHSRYPSAAADIAGNPACIYALLRNWPGGVSTDYGRVKHVHFSYEPHGREWGARFQHYGHHRYARHRHMGHLHAHG